MNDGQVIHARGRGRGNNSNRFLKGRDPRDFGRGGHHSGTRHVDGDGDVMMRDDTSSDHSRNRFNPYGSSQRHQSRRGRYGSQHSNREGSRLERELQYLADKKDWWNRVMLPMARRITKELAIELLIENCSIPIVPFNLHFHGNSIVFYLKDLSSGIALKKLDGKVQTADGFRIKIITRLMEIPRIFVSEDIHAAIRERVKQRYLADHQVLDLSHFHQDDVLRAQNLSLYFKEHNIAMTIAKVVIENLGPVSFLNMSGNKISNLEFFNRVNEKLTALKVLNLDNNEIASLSDLSPITGFPLVDLTLRNNPLMKRSKEKTRHIDAVRQRFPKLLKLDGEDLPPQIGFEIENPVTLPPSKDGFFANDRGKEITLKFFEEYFKLYDSNRRDIAAAYHENAVFSLVAVKSDQTRGITLGVYMQHSRNMLKVPDQDRRKKLIYKGVPDIISCLMRLPKTQHDPSTVFLDVVACTSSFLSVTISGLFKELETSGNKSELCRAFSRSCIIVPYGSGCVLVLYAY
ncbi:Nuclear RNA export factor [Chamberlinius hualienensis]